MKPDFLIIGCPKSGTSSLHSWLNSHPTLIGSNPKETYFFIDQSFHSSNECNFYNNRSDWQKIFRSFFPSNSEKIIKHFESTVQNIYCDSLLESIKDINNEIKVIVIIRDPIERIRSTYQYYKDNKSLPKIHSSFEEYAHSLINGNCNTGNQVYDSALKWSKYDFYLSKWIKKLGQDNVFVETQEKLKENPIYVLQKIERFLNIKNYFSDGFSTESRNVTVSIKNKFFHNMISPIGKVIPSGAIKDKVRKAYRKINSSKREELVIKQDIRDKLTREINLDRNFLLDLEVDLSSWD